MTDTPILGGGVDNGRRGSAAFTFYSGPVGIRDRGDRLEVAFFGAAVTSELPIQGKLDGSVVIVVEIVQRALTSAAARPAARAAPAIQSIVATVIPIPSE